MAEKLRDDYLSKVMEAINIKDAKEFTDTELLIGLLSQANLLLDKMCNLMFIATGLNVDDIPEDLAFTQDSLKSKIGLQVICGQCGKGVVPDRMGYCPLCKNDLSKQVASDNINKSNKPPPTPPTSGGNVLVP